MLRLVGRISAHGRTLNALSRLNLCRDEFVRRQGQIFRPTFADAAGGVYCERARQNQPSYSPDGRAGCTEMVQMPITTSRLVAGLDALGIRLRIRQAGDVDLLGLVDFLGVRWKMKTGLERQNTLTICIAIGPDRRDRSAAAMVEASDSLCISAPNRAARRTDGRCDIQKVAAVCSAETRSSVLILFPGGLVIRHGWARDVSPLRGGRLRQSWERQDSCVRFIGTLC